MTANKRTQTTICNVAPLIGTSAKFVTMASELSTFIQQELEQRGYRSPAEKQNLVIDNTSTSIGIENRSREQAQRPNSKGNLRKYFLVVGVLVVIVVVWIVLLATATARKDSDDSSSTHPANTELDTVYSPNIKTTVSPLPTLTLAPIPAPEEESEQEAGQETPSDTVLSDGDNENAVNIVPATEPSPEDVAPAVSPPSQDSGDQQATEQQGVQVSVIDTSSRTANERFQGSASVSERTNQMQGGRRRKLFEQYS
eukprot:TRINITY_DN4838_c2_g1_i1.p2 TRINITY_DN4838_c2_g1~~TRINITY_DN4838_c2_g1_i1.p2  ORF type:complete len:255 (+),score=20.87 TRINITY_DN4838_c2_g1_i1:23-787(+)